MPTPRNSAWPKMSEPYVIIWRGEFEPTTGRNRVLRGHVAGNDPIRFYNESEAWELISIFEKSYSEWFQFCSLDVITLSDWHRLVHGD